jgi:predicted MPP superfamily phosphohydrolase
VKNLFRICSILVLIAIALYSYARFIEPSMIDVNYITVEKKYIHLATENIKVLQFSDLHISNSTSKDELQKIVDKINGENPDIVVFTGDLFDEYSEYLYKDDIDSIWEILNQINAPKGKYAVYGNHDYGGGAVSIYREVMEKSGFDVLVNDKIYLSDINLNIIGMDDSIFGTCNNEELKQLLDEDCFNLVLSHEPDVIDNFLEDNIDLFLSGHSHGGQINLPFIRVLPKLGVKYVRGLYEFENYRNTKLYVNIGIGTSQLPLRFMAVPELTVFTIK